MGCAQSGSPGGSSGGASKSAPRNPGAAEKEEAAPGSQKKVRRQWESWSTEDKNTFFQGLYEVTSHLSLDAAVFAGICWQQPRQVLGTFCTGLPAVWIARLGCARLEGGS